MVVLITGISSGFGLEMAKRLCKEGHTVYGTVRRDVPKLHGVHYLTADVRNEKDAIAAVETVVGAEGRLDVLITNAGMGIGGPVEFNTEEEIELQMDTNFMGQVRFVKAALPHLRAQHGGKIICFSSLGGRMGLPFQGYYCASKFAIEGFCEALRMEVKGYGIDVVVVEPGDFATGFTAARRKDAVSQEAMEAYPCLQQSVECFENEEKGGLTPDRLAKRVAKIVRQRRPRCRYVISNLEQRLSLPLKAILPDSLYCSLMRSYYKMN